MDLWQLSSEDKFRLLANSTVSEEPFGQETKEVDCGDSPHAVYPLLIFGKTFVVRMRPSEEFFAYNPVQAGKYALFSSLLIALAATMLVASAVNRREALERIVDSGTAALQKSESQFRILVEDTPFPVMVISLEGAVMFCNRQAENFFSFPSDFMRRKNFVTEFSIFSDVEAFPDFVDKVRSSGGVQGKEISFLKPDGTSLWGLLSARDICFDGEEAVIIALQDITERKAVMDRLQLADQFFRTTSEGIVVTDAQGFIEDGNPALEELTGYSLEEIRGKRPGIFSAQRAHDESSERFWDALQRNGVWQGEVWNRHKDGEAYPVWLTVTAVKDESGMVTHYAGALTHIGDIKLEQQRLSHMAHHDSLTGLPNRLLLQDRLEMALARARREKCFVAVAFLDLDEFKDVNDTFGHETGDLLLVAVGRRLVESIREQDTAARLGGDEFVLVLDGFSCREEAFSFVERIHASFRTPFQIGGRMLSIHASIGVAVSPDDGSTADDLLARADESMYLMKWRKRERHLS